MINLDWNNEFIRAIFRKINRIEIVLNSLNNIHLKNVEYQVVILKKWSEHKYIK
jgi:hypothetical protein